MYGQATQARATNSMSPPSILHLPELGVVGVGEDVLGGAAELPREVAGGGGSGGWRGQGLHEVVQAQHAHAPEICLGVLALEACKGEVTKCKHFIYSDSLRQ